METKQQCKQDSIYILYVRGLILFLELNLMLMDQQSPCYCKDKEVEGLQVLKYDQWFNIPIVPQALLINVGDQIEAMTPITSCLLKDESFYSDQWNIQECGTPSGDELKRGRGLLWLSSAFRIRIKRFNQWKISSMKQIPDYTRK
ncbi:hypothetical protein F3Y22_tig00110299pilonHSYRG00051 [Hibiscus syriacus]|uniref:Isopenicillin N synthase-like Fe(2+) 2OG dioxygenase domain-containing protein n=1 Tax=Hibiscus syriacus TaxID=106335 RepID=A0A6A3B3Y4_HIBSY|nr:hypothetical protein F3Y22_tig00110299pilonHSYRG00051 [Hibiscus syriacus]